ncbi:hypothetical protein EZZ79_18260 [Pseudomonas syringae]|nr:hypothetical protein EZZ79_18260 [Pseudomonas syringae]
MPLCNVSRFLSSAVFMGIKDMDRSPGGTGTSVRVVFN